MKATTATVRAMLNAGTALSLVMFGASSAWAQEAASEPPAEAAAETEAAPTAATTEPDAAGDIVVTAQRREERLSRVPVSVVTFDADTLQSKAIVSEQDVGSLVPGLTVKNGQNSNQLSFSMRGQTLDPFSGTSPAVLTYINEAPYNPYNTSTVFFDLESVQVLKGPQGTLFGRNATGGAVLYTTPTPGNEIAGNLIVRAGERHLIQIQGAIDLPIVKDVLSIRVAGDFTKQDGFMNNLYTGNTLGDKESKAGRLTVLLTPSDTIRNTFLIQYSKFGGTEGTGNLYNYYTFPDEDGVQFVNNGNTSVPNPNPNPLTSTLDTVYNVFSGLLFNRQGFNLGDSNLTPGPAIGPGRFPGGVAGFAAFSRANPYDTYLEFDLPHKAHSTFLSNTTELDVSDTATVKNIFSYMKSFSRTPGNLAGGPFGALWLYIGEGNVPGLEGGDGPGGQEFTAKQFSDELQLQGKAFSDRLQYTVGAFYSSFKHFDIIPVFVGSEIDPTAGAAPAFGLPANIVYTYNSKNISKALYGQVDYKITDALKATVGGRYSWEDVELSQATGSLFALLGISPVGVKQKRKLSAPSWTLSLQYQINPSNMVYAAHRGSFRSGNFNGTVLPLNDANFFKSEKAKDFEVGYKFSGRLGSMPARFNLAVYQVTVKDAQHAVYAIVGGNPAGFTLNVPEAKTTGVEVDGYVAFTPWFNVSANAAYNNARYTKGVVDTSDLTGVPGSTILFDSYPDTPKFSTSIGAEFRLPVGSNAGEVLLSGDLYKQTSSFFSSNEGSVTPGTKLKGYTTVNARLSWNNIMQSKFSAAVYVKNLFDKLYYVSGYAMGAAGGYNTAYPGEPRTIAGEVSVKF